MNEIRAESAVIAAALMALYRETPTRLARCEAPIGLLGAISRSYSLTAASSRYSSYHIITCCISSISAL